MYYISIFCYCKHKICYWCYLKVKQLFDLFQTILETPFSMSVVQERVGEFFCFVEDCFTAMVSAHGSGFGVYSHYQDGYFVIMRNFDRIFNGHLI